MTIYSLILILLHLVTLLTTSSTSSDHYLLSCGASSSVVNAPSAYDGRTWHSDNNSTFSNDFSSTVAASTTSTSNAPQNPFLTARIFTANFTYSFPVSPGPKFIRLFFNPSTYSESYLTLQTNTGHLLLRNFSAYLSLNISSYMFKEFYVHVNTSLLQLTFFPTPPSTRAFINGIEIVSVPENLYVGPTAPKYIFSQQTEFDLTNSTAMETAYRLNVGGAEVVSVEDSGSMYRSWENDDIYLMGNLSGIAEVSIQAIKYTAATPNYSAPTDVYQTLRGMDMGLHAFFEVIIRTNVKWGFEVDFGFHYLVRLHWCEIDVRINASNYRVFDVYIDQLTADEAVDIFGWVGADTAAHRDYVVYMDGGNGSQSRGVLQLAMHPNIQSNPKYLDILLNGLEIFKLSRLDGSLDAPNPTNSSIPFPDNQPPSSKSPSNIVQTIRVAISSALVIVILLYEQMKIY